MSKMVSVFWSLLFSAVALASCSIDINPSAVNTSEPFQELAWKNLNLTGKLIYNNALVEPERIFTGIQSLDLTTGEISTIFDAPPRSWVDAVAVSPDATTLIMSFKPPDKETGQTTLYSMPLHASQSPQPLFVPPTDRDQYALPYWSRDGKYIYFVHLNADVMFSSEIMRMIYPDGNPEVLIPHATWPRLSEDGAHLVYVALDAENGKNSLFIANPDGTNPQQVVVTGLPVPTIIDAPMFSADNQAILFSSPLGAAAHERNVLEKMMGVIAVAADGTIPSDWWTVPASGGNATQITKIHSLGLYGWFSPDQKYIASYSANGIFVMKPDGGELTIVVGDIEQASGTVNWIR